MQKPLSSNIAEYLKSHLRKKRWKQVVTVLACLVVFGTTYALILPAITMTGETFCGKDAHTHSEEAGCYTQGEAHVHTDECYEEASVLTCGLAETEGHTHGESCYDKDGNLICGQEEAEAHTHTEACYTTQKTLVCGKDEGAVESVLTCEKEEHEHTLACYSNPDADTDAPALPALSGNAAADAAAIAKAQLGYAESSKNYAVAPDGETAYGYTCYGAAYGNAYADDWSALFARYCLDKAGVSEDFPRANTCAGWIAALTAQELYHGADYTPKPGDAAFYDLDGDGAAEHAGIVLDAETAAVGDVDGKVEKEDLTAATGFGALPTSGPKKAAAADTSKPTFDLTFSGNSHGADGEWLFYTGEALTARISISDNAKEGMQTETDDGTVARVYMRFSKAESEGTLASADGILSFDTTGYIKASGSGNEYAFTVTRLDGEDENHYTYYFEIQRPLHGDTLAIDLPCIYPSPTSAGGTAEIWGGLLTKDEKGAGVHVPEENIVRGRWETKADDFSLSISNYKTPQIKGDADGNTTITDLKYSITTKRDAQTTQEGVGKDYVTSITFTETITPPEGTHFQFSDTVLEAIRSKNYYQKSKYVWGDNSGYYVFLYVKGTDEEILQWDGQSTYSTFDVAYNETDGTLQVTWEMKNGSTSTSKPGASWTEFQPLPPKIKLPDLYFDGLAEGREYTVHTDVTATYHYSWSQDKVVTTSKENKLKLGAAKLKVDKNIWSSSCMGSEWGCALEAKNEGQMPYTALAFLEDTMPPELYLSAAQIATPFNDTYGKGFSVEILNATICKDTGRSVTATDGSTALKIPLSNTSADIDGKYNGLWTTADPSVQTTSAKICISWDTEKSGLVLVRTDDSGRVEEKSVTCASEETTIQDALDALGLIVTNQTQYRLRWDLRDEHGNAPAIAAGKSIFMSLRYSVKSSFMMLEQDVKEAYPQPSIYYRNYAYWKNINDENIASDSAGWSAKREVEFEKTVTDAEGGAITEGNVPKDGDVLTYQLQVADRNATMHNMPLIDHMTGAQVLLAEKEKNVSADWADGCPTVTVDGTEYYKLSREGVYSGVWIGGYYADTVTVSETSSGRDTLIKWFFKSFSGTTKISYKSLVCPQELSVSGMTFTLNNESWLNDHVSHRLHADIGGEIVGSMVSFDKKIVPESDVGAEQKVDGEKESSIGEGETVYYRIAIHPAGEGGEEAGSITLDGNSLRDRLPLGLRKDETDYLKWYASKDQMPGSVWIVAYENATSVSNKDHWDIEDDGVENQQNIRWNDDFSVTFPANQPLYIYIRLTFPSGDNWQEYAAQYSLSAVENTFYLNGVGSAVSHSLKVEAKAYLQKGVYWKCILQDTGGFITLNKEDYTTYFNSAHDNYGTIYYVTLRNEGSTRLYVTELYDIMPRGFDYYGVYRTTVQPVKAISGGTSCTRKDISVSTSTTTLEDETKQITFKIKQASGSNSIHYDESRQMCYLDPGEAIAITYKGRIANSHSRTDDVATNRIAMPYYDYNHGGVRVSDVKLVSNASADKMEVPNDGECRLIDNTQAVAAGFTGVSNDTQWLYSEVTQYRGEIKPGITKQLAAVINADESKVEQNPISARPTDTLRWLLTVHNDGTQTMLGYTLTDTMQAPYLFNGDVHFKNVDANGYTLFDNKLFTITTETDGTIQVESAYTKTTLTANGKEAYLEVPRLSNRYGEMGIYVRMAQDSDTKNYSLSIRFAQQVWGIYPGKSAELTVETKRTDTRQENAVFVNTCYVTPAQEQTWDGTTNHGNVTTFDPNGEDPNRLSVRNSAPVTTAYGFATSSLKTVELTGTPETKATGNDGTNYIVLPDKNTREITYTLQVDAPEDTRMTSLTFIDTLPYEDDHTSFQQDDPRFSEFAVDFADNPNVTVTVTDENGVETTLDASQYTVSYSDKTEFDPDEWRGVSAWSNFPTGMRTLRVAITDKEAIPAKSHVTVRFNAVVSSDADYGQSAWNSFGYHYGVGTGQELEAAPLKVGVKMPTRPYLQKSLVDREGKSVIAKQDETFRFLLYSGQSLKTADEAAIAESGRTVSVIDLTVPQGASVSEKMMLKDLKVWTYADSEWTQTEKDWTWTQNGSYTIIELPQSDDPEYRFQSLNRRTDATGYTFIYQNDQTQQISAVNLHDVWSLTIRKVDQTAQDITIAGAWFALYSPEQADALDYEALRDKPTNKPAETIEQGGTTWYLAQVAQTGNVESEQGSLTWSGLRRETYLYQEIQAPKGYLLDQTIRTITKTGYPQTVTVTNEGAGYELPQTGGPGVAPFLLSGGLIFGGAAFALLRRRKREGAA